MIRISLRSVRTPVVTADIRNLADEEVMQLVGEGSPRAFELLYDRHGGAAFSLAYRMVGDRVMAEDISQEAFLCTGSHDHRDPAFGFDNAAITIGQGAWITARALVHRGTAIPSGEVVVGTRTRRDSPRPAGGPRGDLTVMEPQPFP